MGAARAHAGRAGAAAAIGLALCAACASPPARRAAAPPPDEVLARVARQCVRVASCTDAHDPAPLRAPGACVDWWLLAAPGERPLADCLMRARSCAAVEACTHAPADPAATEYCRAHPGTLSACDGARFVSCEGKDGAESTAVDCASMGAACGERADVELLVRGCVAPGLCPSGAPALRCDGAATLLGCTAGIADRRTCPPGTRCASTTDADGMPSAACLSPAGRGCEGGSSAGACEGDVALACVPSGHYAGMHVAHCAAHGLTCAVRGGRAVCERRAASCAPGPARCEAGSLLYCAAGTKERVSCASLGFSSCDPAGAGAEAACR